MCINNFSFKTAGIIFYFVTMLTSIIFFRVAMKWRSIMIFWERNETVFLKHPYVQTNELKRKIVLSGSILFLIGTGNKIRFLKFFYLNFLQKLAEHSLAKASAFYGYNAEANYCNDTVSNRFRYYATREYYHIFDIFNYHPGIAIALWVSIVQRF